jgi:hypothetical protein
MLFDGRFWRNRCRYWLAADVLAYDVVCGCMCLQGLPPEWQAMLSSSGITKEEVAAHPQAVVDVLQVLFCTVVPLVLPS